jgi:acyl-CoA synthetase (AMP-forming)/AMP-acid ligase II
MASATIVDVLRLRAETQRDEIAYRFLADGEEERSTLTYGELYSRARRVASELQKQSAPGQRALLLDSSEAGYIVTFFGCLCAGVIAVPIYAPRLNKKGNARVESVVADAQPSVVLTAGTGSPAVRDAVTASAGEHVKWIDTNALPVDGDQLWTPPAVRGTDIAFLQYTSGSTAAPKGVMVSHANILDNERMIQNAFDTKPGSVIVGWLPLFHDMGLIGNVLQPLYAGVPCILMSPVAFLQRPLRWLQAISRYQATTSGGPNFAYELCMRKIRPEDRSGLDLSSWRVAFNGAEPVRLETVNRFAAQFADCGFRREAFVPCYGLAEATLFVSGGLDPNGVTTVNHGANGNSNHGGSGNEAKISRKQGKLLVASGRPPLEQSVRIVSPDSLRPCSAGDVGEIWISGPSVAQGYWRKAKETEETFNARIPEIDEGPFLRTGDLGFLKDGHLFITGRLKDLLIIRGQNYYPQDIELTVEQSHPILPPGSGAAFSVEIEGEERLIVVQEVAVRKGPESIVQSDLDELDALIKLISRNIVAGHELQAFAIVLIRKGTIPKTSSGKIQRHACRDAFLNRELYVLREWQERKQLEPVLPKPSNPELDGQGPYGLASWVAQEISRTQGIDQERVDLNQPFAAYGLDSLAAIEFAHKLQAEFQVEVDVAEFFGDSTITEVIRRATKNTQSPVKKAEKEHEKATQESFAGLPIPGLLKEDWRRFIQAGEEYLKTLDEAIDPNKPLLVQPNSDRPATALSRVGSIDAKGPAASLGGNIIILDLSVAANVLGWKNGKVSRIDITFAPKVDRAKVQQEVLRVVNGRADMDAIERHRPALVVLDLMLPKTSGVEVLKKLRAEPQFATIPVMVFTNAYVPSMVNDALQSGATKVFNKAEATPRSVVEALKDAGCFAREN